MIFKKKNKKKKKKKKKASINYSNHLTESLLNVYKKYIFSKINNDYNDNDEISFNHIEVNNYLFILKKKRKVKKKKN